VEAVGAVGVIRLARAYDEPPPGDHPAYLVERLWPRGVRKSALRLTDWLRDVAPSPELRKWFGHDPRKWDEFRRRYVAELDEHPEAWRPLLDAAAVGDVTLVYSSHDIEHNNAVALRDYLVPRLDTRGPH
jgi:uncharacterized protein YeaO (DUF488 family)